MLVRLSLDGLSLVFRWMLIGVPLNGVSIGIREIFAGGIVKRRSLDTRWMVVVAVVVGSDRVQDSAQCRARRYNCTNEFTSKSICKSAAIVNHFNAKSVMHRPTSLQDVLHYDRTLNKNYEDPVLWQVSLVTAMTLNRQRFSLDARYVLVRLSLDGLSLVFRWMLIGVPLNGVSIGVRWIFAGWIVDTMFVGYSLDGPTTIFLGCSIGAR